jgi:hypothetical protein
MARFVDGHQAQAAALCRRLSQVSRLDTGDLTETPGRIELGPACPSRLAHGPGDGIGLTVEYFGDILGQPDKAM